MITDNRPVSKVDKAFSQGLEAGRQEVIDNIRSGRCDAALVAILSEATLRILSRPNRP